MPLGGVSVALYLLAWSQPSRFCRCRAFVWDREKFKTQNPNLSQSLTTDEFDAFWKEADSNGDGKLDYEEFIKMMRQY